MWCYVQVRRFRTLEQDQDTHKQSAPLASVYTMILSMILVVLLKRVMRGGRFDMTYTHLPNGTSFFLWRNRTIMDTVTRRLEANSELARRYIAHCAKNVKPFVAIIASSINIRVLPAARLRQSHFGSLIGSSEPENM